MNNLVKINNFNNKFILSGCCCLNPFSNQFLSLNTTLNRFYYTFRLSNKLVKNKRTTRPKKTTTNSFPLNYEQAQFAEKIGLTKSWNSWNTSNLIEGKRRAENAFDDFLIRKFLYGTFHGLFSSEILIKRRFNQINIGFLVRLPKGIYSQNVYFLVGYSEELLSSLLKSVVKIHPQTITNKQDIIHRYW